MIITIDIFLKQNRIKINYTNYEFIFYYFYINLDKQRKID